MGTEQGGARSSAEAADNDEGADDYRGDGAGPTAEQRGVGGAQRPAFVRLFTPTLLRLTTPTPPNPAIVASDPRGTRDAGDNVRKVLVLDGGVPVLAKGTTAAENGGGVGGGPGERAAQMNGEAVVPTNSTNDGQGRLEDAAAAAAAGADSGGLRRPGGAATRDGDGRGGRKSGESCSGSDSENSLVDSSDSGFSGFREENFLAAVAEAGVGGAGGNEKGEADVSNPR